MHKGNNQIWEALPGAAGKRSKHKFIQKYVWNGVYCKWGIDARLQELCFYCSTKVHKIIMVLLIIISHVPNAGAQWLISSEFIIFRFLENEMVKPTRNRRPPARLESAQNESPRKSESESVLVKEEVCVWFISFGSLLFVVINYLRKYWVSLVDLCLTNYGHWSFMQPVSLHHWRDCFLKHLFINGDDSTYFSSYSVSLFVCLSLKYIFLSWVNI